MKVITIKQPWAWAIAEGIKPIENRSWSTSYRGQLLIHAGKAEDALGCEGDLFDCPPYTKLDYGAIVAVVTISDCLPSSQVNSKFALPGMCWMLTNAIKLNPLPISGKQGIWTLDAKTLGLLMARNPNVFKTGSKSASSYRVA